MKKPLTPRQAQVRFNAIVKVIQARQARALELINNPPFATDGGSGIRMHRRAITLNQKSLNAALDKMMLFCLNNHTFPARVDALIDAHKAKRVPTKDWTK